MEDLEITCPHCQSLILFDKDGEPYTETEEPLEANQYRGLGGLISVDATAGWRNAEYRFNQQGQALSTDSSELTSANEEINHEQVQDELVIAETVAAEGCTSEEFVHDEELQEIIDTDLSNRNLKLKLPK